MKNMRRVKRECCCCYCYCCCCCVLCGLGGEEWVHVGRWQGVDWRRLDLGRLMMSRAGFVVAEGRLGYENCVLIPGDLRSVLFSWKSESYLELELELELWALRARVLVLVLVRGRRYLITTQHCLPSGPSHLPPLYPSLFRSSLNKQGTSVVYLTIYGICLLVVPYTLYLT